MIEGPHTPNTEMRISIVTIWKGFVGDGQFNGAGVSRDGKVPYIQGEGL